MAEPKMLIPLPDAMARLMKLASVTGCMMANAEGADTAFDRLLGTAQFVLKTMPKTPVMRNMDCAPLDGTLVQLLVRFDHNGIEDTNEPAWTIGSHNDGEWNFVGWCWHTDQWARGSGDLLAWLPVGPNVNSTTA